MILLTRLAFKNYAGWSKQGVAASITLSTFAFEAGSAVKIRTASFLRTS